MKKIVIIGGGINGAGIARDAALRGWDVTLLEMNDFCSGTSWASSKLIHGGLRYLEHGEINLVRESLRERETLLRIHRHNIQPLHLLLAVYRHSPHRLTTLRLGMKMYEFLSEKRSLPVHEFYTEDQLNTIEPGLDKRKLRGGIAYWDAQCIYPERLVIANLHTAEENGAELHNYHKVIRLNKKSGRIVSVLAMNILNGEEKEFEADMVVNATGPWIDALLQKDMASHRPLIGGTRGSHIMIPKFADGPRHAIYVNARLDGRPFFILPWRNYYLIGTTDVRHTDTLEELSPTYAEIDYLITETNHCFPSAELDRNKILFSFSGVRPLPFSTKKNPGAITRRHLIIDHAKHDGIANLVSLIGGKLTTYRHMAEQVVDLIGLKSAQTKAPCSTAGTPLWGGDMDSADAFVSQEIAKAEELYSINEKTLRHLVTLYGTHYREVLNTDPTQVNGPEAVCPHSTDIRAQIVFAVRHEWAKKLADVMFRRTPIGMNVCLGMDACERTAEIMGNELGWNEKKRKEEIQDYRKYVTDRLLSHKS